MKQRNKQAGFTIVELMIAISVLSVILLVVTVGILQMSKNYYKNIIQTNTQQAARTVLDTVAQSVEFGSFNGFSTGTVDKSGTYGLGYIERAVCIGPQRYSYVLPFQQSSTNPTQALTTTSGYTRHTLWKDSLATACTPQDVGQNDPSGGTGNGHELLGEHMRLTRFDIKQAMINGTPSSSLYTISITVMYGDDDLIDQSNPDMSKWTCKILPAVFSTSFCAKSELTTVVGKRLS